MKVQVQKSVGGSIIKFEVDEPKTMDALFEAGFVASTPERCTACSSEDVQLTSNKAKGFSFVKVVCNKCYAQSQVGQYKDGGYFWKRFEKYEKGDDVMDLPE